MIGIDNPNIFSFSFTEAEYIGELLREVYKTKKEELDLIQDFVDALDNADCIQFTESDDDCGSEEISADGLILPYTVSDFQAL